MRKADIAFGIDNAIQRHSSQLEELHLLPVGSCHRMVWIGQSDKRDLLIDPILLKDRQWIGADSQDFHVAAFELFITIPHTRQLRAAVGSHKAAQKCQHDGLATQIG